VGLVRINISEEHITSIIRVTRIGEIGTKPEHAAWFSCLLLWTLFLARRVLQFIVNANFVPSAPILVTPMIQTIHSSDTSVLTKVTWYNIPEDAVLHSLRCEHLKSYIALTGWSL
jgi:hypothetical protein